MSAQPMLSRTAASVYWMTRYIERAENAARIVDVNLQLFVDFRNLDDQRFAGTIDQIALTYKFKSAKPKPEDIFDASYLPPAAARKVN